MAWDAERRIRYVIQYPTDHVEIYLDDLLPRIVLLCEKAADRATAVAAMEALHAIMIVMVKERAVGACRRLQRSESA
jgi:hypothetical protein